MNIDSGRKYARRVARLKGHELSSFTRVNKKAGSHLRSWAMCTVCYMPVEVDTELGILGQAHLNYCRKGLRVVS
jgi:hypothetical protein